MIGRKQVRDLWRIQSAARYQVHIRYAHSCKLDEVRRLLVDTEHTETTRRRVAHFGAFANVLEQMVDGQRPPDFLPGVLRKGDDARGCTHVFSVVAGDVK